MNCNHLKDQTDANMRGDAYNVGIGLDLCLPAGAG